MARPTAACREQAGVNTQFRCELCSRLFSTKGNLSRHVLGTHVGGHTFPCPTCGKEFKRKEDLTTHIRVHTGERPYWCDHVGCGRRFARVSDLRSHERTHRSDAKAFPCLHPGCGKRFTRPYDLKKHQLSQHWGGGSANQPNDGAVRAGSTDRGGGGGGRGSNRAKRKLSEMRAPCDTFALVSKAPPFATKPLPPVGGNIVDDLLRSNEAMLQQQQQQQQQQPKRRRQEPDAVPLWATVSPSIAQEPPSRPAHAKHAAASHAHHRKRIRCDAHKHLDPVDTGAGDDVVSAQNAGKPSKSGGGAAAVVAGAGVADGVQAHVHGASCGHLAVLHEDHVDFLMGDGKLECYDGKETTREGWVSSTNEGDDASCGCDDTAKATPGSATATSDGIYHWDGAGPDEPRGRCVGHSHGPECGHDVVHHDGHLDYVVNGRLIHPVASCDSAGGVEGGAGGEGGVGAAFEDHGSIRTLDDSIVTFLDFVAMLDAATVDADDMAPFCDLCSSHE